MYPPPADSLADATVRELDDQFFTSDPDAYIRSRIRSLLTDSTPAMSGDISTEFTRLLGPSAVRYDVVDVRTRNLQVAVDAFAVRHQVAETLIRFLHVLLHHEDGCSHWVELTDTPFSNRDVCKENFSALNDEAVHQRAMLRSLLLPPGLADSADSASTPDATHDAENDLIDKALDVHGAWINYATRAFIQQHPDLDAAHNKFKHGIGLRPQDDLLSTLTLDPPNQESDVSLSALTGDRAIDLFDGITAEYLARSNRRGGLEATQLAMVPAPTLVEAAAMAHTLALLFHTAGVKHFGDHEPHEGRTIAPYPGLLVDGPVPGKLRPLRPFALRFPLTNPLRDPENPHAAMFWTNGDANTLIFGEQMEGRVVDDTSAAPDSPGNGDAHDS